MHEHEHNEALSGIFEARCAAGQGLWLAHATVHACSAQARALEAWVLQLHRSTAADAAVGGGSGGGCAAAAAAETMVAAAAGARRRRQR